MNASLVDFSHQIGLMDVSARQDYAPVVKSGYHLRFPTSYPGFKSRRAHHHILLRSVHQPALSGSFMLPRQKLGIVLMFLFLPINGPMWRMGLAEMGYEVPLGDFQGFVVTLILFVTGAVMTFMPELRWPSD